MRFLRSRDGKAELTWLRTRYTAVDRERALHVLGDAVMILRHPYEAHPNSGAGNCWCGRPQSSSLHDVLPDIDGDHPGRSPQGGPE